MIRRACFHAHRSSSPHPKSGDRRAVTVDSRSVGSATARATAIRSRISDAWYTSELDSAR